MVVRRANWGEDRVFYYGPEGTLKSLPAGLTDVAPLDVFARISAGRSAFRVDDLLELRQLLNEPKRNPGSGDGV